MDNFKSIIEAHKEDKEFLEMLVDAIELDIKHAGGNSRKLQFLLERKEWLINLITNES